MSADSTGTAGSTGPAISRASATASSGTRRFDATHLNYEATMDDPQTFTRPWKISMPLYKIVDKDFRLYDHRCVDLAEEALYGRLTAHPCGSR